MSRSLTYFDIKGLGEGIRYLLHYGNLEFEDVRISSSDEWFKDKNKYPFGKIPVYKEGDIVLNQSVAIARYIGNKLNLEPKDPLEQAQLNAIIDTYLDYVQCLKPAIYEKDPEKKEELTRKLRGETTDFYFSRFNQYLAENDGFFNKKLSWADIFFVGLVDMTIDFIQVDITKYPNITALRDRVHQYPGIKAYLENLKK